MNDQANLEDALRQEWQDSWAALLELIGHRIGRHTLVSPEEDEAIKLATKRFEDADNAYLRFKRLKQG
jgi:hypothetical protein